LKDLNQFFRNKM